MAAESDPQQENPPHRNPSSAQTPPAPPPDSLISRTVSLQYWSSRPASLTGMLSGYPQISLADLRGSRTFLTKLRRGRGGSFSAASRKRLRLGVDCGAGIGRVTDGLLRHVCERVDVVEPVAKFADVLTRESRASVEGRLGRVWISGLEDWPPPPTTATTKRPERGGEGQRVEEEEGEGEADAQQTGKYDLIWNQWCVGHLTDSQLTAYLRRCIPILKQDPDPDPDNHDDAGAAGNGGWIVVKENLSTDPSGEDVYDELDSCVTRTDAKYRRLFADAGLQVVRAELQTGFPKALGLYPVSMYALRPMKGAS